MGCNCKKIKKYEEENGVLIDETLAEKVLRYAMKVIFFIIFVVMFFAVSPIIFVLLAFKFTLSKNQKIVLPKFLTHGFNNGKKL